MKEQYSWENISGELFGVGSQLLSFVSTFPFQMRDILSKLRKGKITFQVENRGYEPVIKSFNQAANRFILAFIIGALLITSAISMNAYSNVTDHPGGMPLISLMGFLLAGILSFFLLVAAWRNK